MGLKWVIARNFLTLNESYTLPKGKVLAHYQGRYKAEVNRAEVNTYGSTVQELSTLHSALSEIVSLVCVLGLHLLSCSGIHHFKYDYSHLLKALPLKVLS